MTQAAAKSPHTLHTNCTLNPHPQGMLVAHLPAAYLVRPLVVSALGTDSPGWRRALYLGSVLPDIDMLWFYLIDAQRTHHHHYWTHLPVFWVVALSPALTARPLRLPALGLAVGVLLHLVLDSIAGGIAWRWPLDGSLYRLTEVEPRFEPWWWSFVLHWTFLLELVVCALAGWRLRFRLTDGP